MLLPHSSFSRRLLLTGAHGIIQFVPDQGFMMQLDEMCILSSENDVEEIVTKIKYRLREDNKMNYCVQEIYEAHSAANSNCYMQPSEYCTYIEDSQSYGSCDAQVLHNNNIYMEQAWAVNQPYTCSYPGNVFKSEYSDMDMALHQYNQTEYFTEEKPTFSQVQSPAFSQKKAHLLANNSSVIKMDAAELWISLVM
ncbi:hypothetical protein L345_13071, partial [Ophiophagus hannah]